MTTQSRRRGGARLAQPEPRRSRARPARTAGGWDGGYDGAYSPQRDGRARSRREKKARRRRGRGWMVLAAALAVMLLMAGVYRLWAQEPDLPGTAGSADPGGEGEGGTQPYLSGDRKDKFYTFLIVGRDTGGGGNTDTIMLASYDGANQRAALMSIPRDTMVNVSWDVKKINSVYNMSGGGEAGLAALVDAVADLVGFRPDFTVTLEWEAVGAIVEAIGGVYFDVPFRMYYEDWSQELWINQEAGYRLLSGSDAMQIVRWRKNNCGVPNPTGTDGSDLGRTRVQQDFIAAVVRQCLQLQNLTRINEIARVFAEDVHTDLTVGNLVWFAEQAIVGGFSTENIYSCTMPNIPVSAYSRSYGTNLSYVVPDGAELIETINGHFNPYWTGVTLANLDLMGVDESGGISASSGALRDGGANG